MWTKLHWVDGPWRGKLALAARPRGGDWLQDEMKSWRQAGINIVFSLLTSDEEADLDLVLEGRAAESQGMKFLSFPIPDRQVPQSDEDLTDQLQLLETELDEGRNVVLHCRQGIGRTGLVAACLLLTKGLDAETAVSRLSSTRGVSMPETTEQRKWIDHYAGVFLSVR
jgi:protein-tyrosine phosphatase